MTRPDDSLDAIDPLPPLGERVQPAQPIASDPVIVQPGILRDPDGRLRTDLPQGKQAEQTFAPRPRTPT